MPFLEYDDSRIREASIIIRAAIIGFESNVVALEKNGEVHYWLDSRWNYASYDDPPFAKVIKKEDEKVYVVFRDGREVLVARWIISLKKTIAIISCMDIVARK